MSGNRQASLGRAIKVIGGKRQAQQVAPMPTKLTDKTYYIAFLATGKAGTFDIVDSNTKKVRGITNFDGNSLAVGRELVIDSVRVLQAIAAKDTPVAKVLFREGVTYESILQSDFQMTQGNESLIDLPMTDLTNFKNEDFRAISTTPVLRSKEEFKMQLLFPAEVTVPLVNDKDVYLRIEFRVTEAKKS